MGIRFCDEAILTLTEAARKFPRSGRGKKPDVAILRPWAQRGLRGIRLETFLVGKTLCTTREAVQRFKPLTAECAEVEPRILGFNPDQNECQVG